jgi:anti-sigma factor RsiW
MNLTCREVLDFLSDYLEGALPGATRVVFEEHLAACPACAAYLDNFRTTLHAAKSACAPQAAQAVPEDLVQAILASRRPT